MKHRGSAEKSRAAVLHARRSRTARGRCVETPAGKVCVGDVVLIRPPFGQENIRGIVWGLDLDRGTGDGDWINARFKWRNVWGDNQFSADSVLAILGVAKSVPHREYIDAHMVVFRSRIKKRSPMAKWSAEQGRLLKKKHPTATDRARAVKLDHMIEEYQRRIEARRSQ